MKNCCERYFDRSLFYSLFYSYYILFVSKGLSVSNLKLIDFFSTFNLLFFSIIFFLFTHAYLFSYFNYFKIKISFNKFIYFVTKLQITLIINIFLIVLILSLSPVPVFNLHSDILIIFK